MVPDVSEAAAGGEDTAGGEDAEGGEDAAGGETSGRCPCPRSRPGPGPPCSWLGEARGWGTNGAGWKGRPASDSRGDGDGSGAGEWVGVESGVPYDKGDDMMGLGQGETAGPGTDTE